MQVRKGYKQTELGVIPEDWVTAPFVSIGNIIDGDRGENYPSSEDFLSDGFCLFLNAGNVTKAGFRFSECAFISHEKDQRLNKGKLKRDDIVLTTRGTVGNFAYFDFTVPFEHMRINSGMVILRRDSTLIDTKFLYAFLKSHLTAQQIERLTFGSAQPQLTVKGISEFTIVLPHPLEQISIAAALFDVDALLAAQDKLIAKKRDIKQATMQQLLTGKQRLQSFTGGWELKKLGDILLEISDGATPSTANKDNFDGSISWVVIDDIKDEIRFTKNTLTEKGLRSCAAKLWPPGTLILSTCATIGEVGIAYVPVATKQGICGLVFDDKNAYTNYMKYWFVLNKSLLLSMAQGSSIREVRAPTLIKFEVNLPQLEEQIAIATILSDMDEELTTLEKQRDKISTIKQGMMQELLTGRIRLV